MMLTHQKLWQAIDTVAENCSLTASGLARKCGLDATTFNASKRISPDGRERWPSTETLSKVLEVAGMDLVAFGELVNSLPENPKPQPQKRRREIVQEAAKA
ncbi:helix-turn-helix transcriptional regulator [Microvirga sp. BT688]|uniref:helix-turn-helix transcriptional regulator n=1 Tax=Microvirga sp. TaxID=1873136 RepID=UPI001688E281|nr:helix-turn-helix transcriptional regulator [Microvirga sp.]